MDSPSIPTTTSPRAYHPRFSFDDISIASSTTDEIPETNSHISSPSLGSSGTSIASYKTEKSINSRKSRYNARPRHKYADCGPSHLGVPVGLMSLDIDDALTPEVCESTLGAQPISPNPESVLESRPGSSPGTQQPATEVGLDFLRRRSMG